MVRIVAMASAEVRWNGIPSRNGGPCTRRGERDPGRFVASFLVPPRRSGPARTSSRSGSRPTILWLPVRRAVHIVSVGPYESEKLAGLTDYLPALLALGALAAGCIYFAASYASERDGGARLLALAAGTALLQLLAESTAPSSLTPIPGTLRE